MNIKRILALSLLLAGCNIAVATSRYESENCCPAWGSDYLNPCGWSLQVQGGVNPIVFAQRDSYWVTGCELPSFRHLFKVPWIVGGKIGYNLSSNAEVYVEGDYTQARGKNECFSAIHPLNGESTFTSELSKYSAFGFWVGTRYYFGETCMNWCSCSYIDRASFFVGLQVGFVHHKAINVCLSSVNATPVVNGPYSYPVLFRNNTISAGGNVGIDFAVNDCFSVVFTIEALGNAPARACAIPCAAAPLNGINPNLASIGFNTEVWIPITLGLKYNF